MSERTAFTIVKAAFAAAVVLALAGDAWAYTLPAPEMFGQFLSLATWVVVAFSSVLLYPVYALTRRFRRPKPPRQPAPAEKAHENERP